MTAQIPEKLIYKGEELDLCSTPLEPFFQNTRFPKRLASTSTALWRGYVGTWSIEDGRLYLTDIHAHIDVPDEPEYVEVGMKELFPYATDGVFAHWFTGDLRCSMGALLEYRHMGFMSTYEKDLLILVKRGVVQQEHLVVNGVAPPDASQHHVIAAQYISGKPH